MCADGNGECTQRDSVAIIVQSFSVKTSISAFLNTFEFIFRKRYVIFILEYTMFLNFESVDNMDKTKIQFSQNFGMVNFEKTLLVDNCIVLGFCMY